LKTAAFIIVMKAQEQASGSISKPQGGLERSVHRSKRDYKYLQGSTGKRLQTVKRDRSSYAFPKVM